MSGDHPAGDHPAGDHAAARLHTPICDLLGVRYPIVQTGMGWVAGARLAAATSAAGGLGILASATMSVPEVDRAVASVQERTDAPFGVNLRSDHADIDRIVGIMIQRGVRVASFAQAPNAALIGRLRDAGVVTMPTIAAPRHAEKVAALGVDAVIAQGHEGGGHTGAIPTSLLLPQVCRVVDLPVLGAGGFYDGRGLVAALAWGAAGIAMGTRFLLTKESTVPDDVKARYLQAGLTDTVVTKAIDGAPQRVIKTALVDGLGDRPGFGAAARAVRNALALRRLTSTPLPALFREGLAMKRNGDLSWAQVAMAANAPMLTKAALVDGRLDAGVLPTGQVVGALRELPTVAEVVGSIVAEAEATLERLGGPARVAL
ncbi:nitronate monooxygenase [Acidiferrimicrobium sp. IK]|uniref:NAD(P)H-dependent flavin oxidoreductase n=1 Tax=Acidiferrimicrobium sp. IK TaxID=2871700 RepID=UPI0021CB2586|nr:nitronate monooxygenase [Acidiferrimicrobium sp. IK]MCU4184206.1 nitronate monooxygenase [Acidiferrimicrobium sp. IK]